MYYVLPRTSMYLYDLYSYLVVRETTREHEREIQEREGRTHTQKHRCTLVFDIEIGIIHVVGLIPHALVRRVEMIHVLTNVLSYVGRRILAEICVFVCTYIHMCVIKT